MRIWKLILFVLTICMALPCRVEAELKTFAPGSLIIPMDSYYQPEDDGGVLEAYGLIYQLLGGEDLACIDACGEDQECLAGCEHDISVYWIIDSTKTAIDASDLVIEVTDALLEEEQVDAVARPYNNEGDTTGFAFNSSIGDSYRRITYRGGAFIIDLQELTEAAADWVRDLTHLTASEWSAVDVHEALVEFTANYHRRMQGTPPKIALMNNTEDRTKGNAAILESYLRLAGVCTDVYEVLTPNDIAGIGTGGATIDSRLNSGEFDFLWAPHWEGYKRYNGDLNNNNEPDVEDVVSEVKLFLKSGKALLAECASIETFEFSDKGRFLSDEGFAHNGGTNDAEDIRYNHVASPYSQIGDFPFIPDGGHLHNWRPYQSGDAQNKHFNFDTDKAPSGNAVYRDTVTRFTVDTTGWDYYVGGHAFGNNDYGYVIYLGGHKYASCKDKKGLALPNVHPIKFEFTEDFIDEVFRLKIRFTGGVLTINNIEPLGDDFNTIIAGRKLEVDFSEAEVNDHKIEGVLFRNKEASDLSIEAIELEWDGGDADQKIKKIEDKYTDIKHLDDETEQKLVLTITEDFTIEKDPNHVIGGSGCARNSNCEPENIAGVRYILNTLFHIKYQIPEEPPDDPPPFPVNENEFVRSAPIVAHPWLYQGSFEYPGYLGHFRRFDVTGDNPEADWDTAAGGVPNAGDGNTDGRRVYTATYNQGQRSWVKTDFDPGNVNALKNRLDVSPASNEEAIKVINRLRGKDWDSDSGGWIERNVENSQFYRGNFGGIMHSAPAIVASGAGDSRFDRVKEIAYVGDLYGLLHAIDTATGQEQWAYIPSNLLGKLKYDRANPAPGSPADYAAVDASPTVRDIFYDRDPESDANPSWHTILVCPQGNGGNTVFALDVTDPDDWDVMWEISDTADGFGGGMGHAYRAALDKVLVPETDPQTGETINRARWWVFVATRYAEPENDHGGIHIFAFDLKTGARKWYFSSTYTDTATNKIPGAVTTYDIDGDSFADRVFVGDMNGRMWELKALDGSNPYATAQSGNAVPLFNARLGNPIAVSPAITRRNGHVILVFGAGGTQEAGGGPFYIYAVDATAAGNLSEQDIDQNVTNYNAATTYMWARELESGEQAWSSPTIAANTVFMAVSGGTLESDDPNSDVSGGGRLIALDLDGNPVWDDPITIGKVRGSIFVSNQHIYLTTIDHQIIQVGGSSFANGFGNRAVLRAWRQF